MPTSIRLARPRFNLTDNGTLGVDHRRETPRLAGIRQRDDLSTGARPLVDWLGDVDAERGVDEFGLAGVVSTVPVGKFGESFTNTARVDREFGVVVELFAQGCDRDPQRLLLVPEVDDGASVFGVR